MENFKKNEILKIDSEGLKTIVDNLEVQHGTIFTYLGKDYYLCFFPKEALTKGEIGWFSTSSNMVNGADIYILETLTEEDKRRVIFHEALEAALSVYLEGSKAHDIAYAEELKKYGDRKNNY